MMDGRKRETKAPRESESLVVWIFFKQDFPLISESWEKLLFTWV